MSECIDTIPSPGSSGPAERFGGAFGRAIDTAVAAAPIVLLSALDTVLLWQRRARERASLSGMSDSMLKDVGLTRVDVAQESSKPFWLR